MSDQEKWDLNYQQAKGYGSMERDYGGISMPDVYDSKSADYWYESAYSTGKNGWY